jgi:hypothetical protein
MNKSFTFARECGTDPTDGRLKDFIEIVNKELEVVEQTGGSYKQHGGAVDCKKGSPTRNAIRLAVLAALTGGTVKAVAVGAPIVAGVISGDTACDISILGSSLAVSTCTKYIEFLSWLNSEVLAGKLPFWDYAVYAFTGTGMAVTVSTGLSYGMWVVERIVDIICKVPDFVWPSADPPTPEELASRVAALAKAEAAAAATLREAAAAAAAKRVPADAVGGTGEVPTAPPPGVNSQGGGSVRHKKTRRHRKTHTKRKSYGRRRHRKTKSA